MQRVFFEQVKRINKDINGGGKSKDKKEDSVKPYQWEESIDAISQHYNMSWSEVTDLNIYAFTHRIRFLTHTIKKQNQDVKRR